MKLIGNLRETVSKAKTKEEARNTIRKAGMLLTDEELEQIAGGEIVSRSRVMSAGVRKVTRLVRSALITHKGHLGQFIWSVRLSVNML